MPHQVWATGSPLISDCGVVPGRRSIALQEFLLQMITFQDAVGKYSQDWGQNSLSFSSHLSDVGSAFVPWTVISALRMCPSDDISDLTETRQELFVYPLPTHFTSLIDHNTLVSMIWDCCPICCLLGSNMLMSEGSGYLTSSFTDCRIHLGCCYGPICVTCLYVHSESYANWHLTGTTGV